MVQISTTLVVAALAIAPALAAPVTSDEFETRDVQDLEARARRTSSGVSSTLGRFVGGLWGQRQQSQEPTARDFVDFDATELEARANDKKAKKNNRKQRQQRQQPQRQSTGLSSSVGNFVGSSLGAAASSMNGERDFIDLDSFELEARTNDKKNKKNRQQNRQQRQQPKRQSTGLSSSLGGFVGSALGSAASSMNGERDFIDEDFLEVEARTRRRGSTGFSSSAGRFVGSALGSAASSMVNPRDYFDLEDLEARTNDRKNKKKNKQQNRQQRQQPKRQSTGLSSSLGGFVGSALGSAASSMNGERDFVDFDFDIDARWLNELD